MRPPTRPKRPKLSPDQVLDVAASANVAVNTVKRWLRGEPVRANTHSSICLALVTLPGMCRVQWVRA